jgi:uncharacterized phiE125 gp8 family phage protein
MLSLVTPPTAEPVSLDAAKAHLRVEHALEDDGISAWLAAARQHAEAVTGRQLPPATWALTLDAFPDAGCAILVPRPPLKSVTSIAYIDTAGATQTWPAAAYDVEIPVGPLALHGRIRPAFGEVYPATRAVSEAVTITFIAGYDSVPYPLHAALLLGVGELYVRREQPDLDKAMTRLLDPFKVWH